MAVKTSSQIANFPVRKHLTNDHGTQRRTNRYVEWLSQLGFRHIPNDIDGAEFPLGFPIFELLHVQIRNGMATRYSLVKQFDQVLVRPYVRVEINRYWFIDVFHAPPRSDTTFTQLEGVELLDERWAVEDQTSALVGVRVAVPHR